MTRPVTIIVGNGRSGTNWVMEMLNASSVSFCRNEPQEIESSPIQRLLDDGILEDVDELRAAWTNFLAQATTHCGERDTPSLTRKDYHHRLSHALGLVDLLRRPKVRTACRKLGLRLPSEWRFPRWAGSRTRLRRAHAVLKINDFPAWLLRPVLETGSLRVIHVVRHPCGQAKSALTRHFGRMGAEALAQEEGVYRYRLAMLLRQFPKYRALEPHIREADVLALSTWFWKLNNEALWEVGQEAGSGVYLPVCYESLVADPEAGAARIFSHAGIPLDDATRDLIRRRRHDSVWGPLQTSPETLATNWKESLSEDFVHFVEREILERSPLSALWGD